MAIRLPAGLAVAAMVFVAVAAIAQERRPEMARPEWQMPGPMMSDAPGAQMPGADPFQLLENSMEVQADLGLTKDQLARLQRAARNFRTKLQDLSYPKPGVSREQAQAEIERHVTDTRGMIARELTPAQLARLRQIMLQLEGPCLATIDQQVGQQLSIMPEQDRAIKEACRARAKQMREAFRPPQPPADLCAAMADNRDRIEQIRAHADEQIMAILAPQQQAMFIRMSGNKLRLEPPMPPQCH